jgi:hypothetical protein
MGWIWRHWLLGSPKSAYAPKIGPFIDRGLEFRERSQSYDYIPLHDLYLLHCAIFAGSDAQLEAVARRVTGSAGDKGTKPADNGELYAAAWCGMMKCWILGDNEKAEQESALIWKAYRDRGVIAASKPLVMPWLKRNWDSFTKAQEKDFAKLWQRARQDLWTVKSETSKEAVVTTERYQIEHQWCWAHCGLALLAHRLGVVVVTDPFWLPEAALGTSNTIASEPKLPDSSQLDMFPS